MDHTYTLSDGRQLGYCIYGTLSAKPCLYFHGTPSSRLEPQLLGTYGIRLDHLLEKAGLYLIAIDRPGMGLSTFHPKGQFLSFADDVQALLSHLHIHQCPVLAWSGGGPYALAMAHQYPQTITAVSIVCGFTWPFAQDVLDLMGMNKWYFYLAKHMPWLLRTALYLLRSQKIKPTPPQWITGLPHVDYALLKDPKHLAALAACTMQEACRNGTQGPVYEARSYFSDYGFDITAIQQPMHYWWGLADMTVIRLHAENMERQVPNAVMHYQDGEGHLSIYIHCFEAILQTVVSVA